MLKNPFLVYIGSFGAVLAVYQLGWSEVYPVLSADLLSFFALTFFVAVLLAMMVSRSVGKIGNYQPGQLPKYTALVLLAAFAADIVYTGGIPLVMVISQEFNYATPDLGVPHLHVFTATMAGTFGTIRFADYLYSKRLRYLAEATLPLFYYLLIFYRGPILICMVSWAFVYIIKRGGLGLGRGSIVAVAGLLVLHLFGVMGNLREGGEAPIEIVGRPTDEFRESGIPRTFFWTYIYFTSPTANLQLAVDTRIPPEDVKVMEFIVSEMTPDFVSKRILPLLNTEQVKPPEVSPGLNVASIYGRAYVYLGWIGPILLFGLLAALMLVYLRLIRNSPYGVPCLALLNTFIVFCTFHNMIAFAGLILQLVWPIFLGFPPFYHRTQEELSIQPSGSA